MNWADAYDEKLRLMRFWPTLAAKAYAQGFAEDAENKGRSKGEVELYREMGDAERQKLPQADPIFVDADMVDLVEAASADFEPEPLIPEDLLVPCGFALLEKPITREDVHGKQMGWRAVSWMPTVTEGTGEQGLHVTYYAHLDDPDDYGDLRETVPPGHPMLAYPLTPNHVSHWAFGASWQDMVPAMTELGETYAGIPLERIHRIYGQLWATTQVLFRLMAQKVTTVEHRQVPRAARRRGMRAGVNESEVVVVTLRRLRSELPEEERNVEWSCRWLVRGHWRNQWYPSLNQHRRIWIHETIKGPEDKELRLKPVRAYELVR